MIVPADADTRPNSRTCSLWFIAGRLGKRERSPKWLAGYVQQLVDHEGFPPPLPHYRAGRKVEQVCEQHRWQLDAVEAWFDGLLPPPLREVTPGYSPALAARFAGTLDARAAAIGGAR